jgi:hypothetical protein
MSVFVGRGTLGEPPTRSKRNLKIDGLLKDHAEFFEDLTCEVTYEKISEEYEMLAGKPYEPDFQEKTHFTSAISRLKKLLSAIVELNKTARGKRGARERSKSSVDFLYEYEWALSNGVLHDISRSSSEHGKSDLLRQVPLRFYDLEHVRRIVYELRTVCVPLAISEASTGLKEQNMSWDCSTPSRGQTGPNCQ